MTKQSGMDLTWLFFSVTSIQARGIHYGPKDYSTYEKNLSTLQLTTKA